MKEGQMFDNVQGVYDKCCSKWIKQHLETAGIYLWCFAVSVHDEVDLVCNYWDS